MSEEFFSSDSEPEEAPAVSRSSNKRGKHAPKEASAKKRVSVIREIPGLQKKSRSMYRDPRFDAAYGKVDYEKIRRNYEFLDDYREKELAEMGQVLGDRKLMSRMSEDDVQDLKYNEQSVRSRLDRLKQEKFEKQAVRDYKKETGKKWVKRSEQKQVVRVAKFESMSGRQRRKAIERKRKRKLGKEMKSFAFSK